MRAEHGDVWLLELGADQVRCPSRAEYKRFLARVSDDRKALPEAQEELARAVLESWRRSGLNRTATGVLTARGGQPAAAHAPGRSSSIALAG